MRNEINLFIFVVVKAEMNRLFKERCVKHSLWKFMILLPVLFVQSCGGYKLISRLPGDSPIVIDGKADDWRGNLKYLEEEKAAVAFANDKDFIYLCYTTKERSNIIQILSGGLTVWFKPHNGKTIGVEYPLKLHVGRKAQRNRNDMNYLRLRELYNSTIENNPDYRIVNEDSFPIVTYNFEEKTGIVLVMNYENSKLVFELKIPLTRDKNKYDAVQAETGEEITVRIETGDLEPARRMSNRMWKEKRGQGAGGSDRGGPPLNAFNDSDLNKVDFSFSVILSAAQAR